MTRKARPEDFGYQRVIGKKPIKSPAPPPAPPAGKARSRGAT